MPGSGMSYAPMAPDEPFETTNDAVLGGRLRLRQPLRGHRVGHDAILLAAATGAHAGEHAVDLGSGVGGAGLALAVRVPALKVTLVEIDAGLCALASGNAERNGLAERVNAVACDVEDTSALAAAGLASGSIDHVLMNPPFNDARRQNASPDPRRRLAHVAGPGLLSRWVAAADWLLKPNGSLTLIWRADGRDAVLAALSAAFGDIVMMPVYPRAGAAAIRVLVRALKASDPAARHDAPALVLNDDNGKPTAAAEAVLRHAAPLPLA
jgi:tRNA1(Val) A37 N6-methylase TrmN6